MAAAVAIFSFAFVLLFPLVAQSQQVEFIYTGFNGSETNIITTEGATIIKPSGALRLTNLSHNVAGHAFYHKPIQMIDTNYSFNTSFVFAIVPPSSGEGGYGLAFILSPSTKFPGAQPGHYLGIFNEANNGNASNHIFAVEFDTVKGFKEPSDSEGNHVGVNINGMTSKYTRPASYFVGSDESNADEMQLESGDRIQAWIEYDGLQKVVKVTISPESKPKPTIPLISENINLTPVLEEMMYVGFSAATGNKSSSHYILGWSFSQKGEAPPLNISLLPLPLPREKNPSSFKPFTAVIASLSVFTFILLGLLFFLTLYRKLAHHESLEEWELDCPHRFRYRDLYAATKGFKQSEVIGVGGFGAVYKGILLTTTGSEVAVKKIMRSSTQGTREFAAEIESLGRLRHKNLVNLQGWCKHKNDLLIVYDYVPNGSLDSLIFKPKNNRVLPWDTRFNILKGVACGLLYLHEEWEQVVIHRDVKSSNVLIDAEMNARLGDFGLARLYDHEKPSHTTNVVGTIGYIAPELARTGKVSTSSDVFAYGMLLLEVAAGRRPIDSSSFVLIDHVMECHQIGRVSEAIDPKLNSVYVIDEVELVLELGLLCSHHRPEARPTMRQVTQYLSQDDPLPAINDWGSIDSQSFSEINSRMLLEAVSSNTITSASGGFSTTSINTGR